MPPYVVFPDTTLRELASLRPLSEAGLHSVSGMGAQRVQRYGAALLGLTRHHPIDPHDFLRVVHTFADLPAMVRAERGLDQYA